MRVLLTGAGGFLGSRVSQRLSAAGVDRLRLQYRTNPPAEPTAGGGARSGIELVAANLLERRALKPLVDGVDCIVHLAAGMRGAPADLFLNTVLATRNLLEAAVTAGVRRIVLVSSFAVYRSESLPCGAMLAEDCPIEASGVNKGPYGFAKTRQEQLFRDYAQRHGFESVILRPGVIHGPGGSPLSPRVGLRAFGWFFSLGGAAQLPLTYVDNCADAVALATLHAAPGGVLNVVDDELPRCRDYLRLYRRSVERLRVLPVPYPALLLGAYALASYHRRSAGQLPAVLTPYMVRSMFRPLRYSNMALKQLGWCQRVATADALRLTMASLSGRPEGAYADPAPARMPGGTLPHTRPA